jgi:hypothetical protein
MGRASSQNSTDVPRENQSWNCPEILKQYLLTTFLPSPYHWPLPHRERFFHASGRRTIGGALENAFAAWIGHPVILQVALGDIRVPLRGKLLKDSGETLRMRIGEGWDVDIYKAMVLAVEEDSMTTLPA